MANQDHIIAAVAFCYIAERVQRTLLDLRVGLRRTHQLGTSFLIKIT